MQQNNKSCLGCPASLICVADHPRAAVNAIFRCMRCLRLILPVVIVSRGRAVEVYVSDVCPISQKSTTRSRCVLFSDIKCDACREICVGVEAHDKYSGCMALSSSPWSRMSRAACARYANSLASRAQETGGGKG